MTRVLPEPHLEALFLQPRLAGLLQPLLHGVLLDQNPDQNNRGVHSGHFPGVSARVHGFSLFGKVLGVQLAQTNRPPRFGSARFGPTPKHLRRPRRG